MPDQYDRIRTLIDAEKDVWAEKMGLSHWEIEHIYLDSFYGDDGESDMKVTAVCECRWNYLMARIKWYLPSAARHTEEHLRGTLVHELCHVLLSAEQQVAEALLSLGTAEADAMAEAAWEKLELSTEMCSRAILVANGYKPNGELDLGCTRPANFLSE